MKTYKIVCLSILFFILVCVGDAAFESLVFHEKSFWNAALFEVSTHGIFLRSTVTASFLVFGLIVSWAFRKQELAEQALSERSMKLAESNELLEQKILESKNLEKELRDQEEHYRTIADFTYDWESWINPNGDFLWVSPSCERVTGYGSDEFIADSKLFQRIVHPDDQELVMKHINEPLDLDMEAPHSLDFRIVRKDGQIIWINHVCQPVRGNGGRVVGRRSSNRDITSRIYNDAALKISEERLQHVYEHSQVMMHSIDETGIIRNVNGRWLDIMGYSRDEVLGHSISFVMTPESARKAKETVLPNFWRDGLVRDVSYQYVTKDGTILDVLLDSVVMDDPVWGRISLSTVRNITLRKRAEEETRRTKALLDSIIQNLPTAVFLKDAAEFRFVLWNRACEELYGYKHDDVLGKTAAEVFQDQESASFESQDRQVLTSGQLMEIHEQFITTRDDKTRILHSKKLPIIDDNGKTSHLLGISEDITARKTAENDLIAAREAAEQASQAKSSFLANMSHEIRTPMNGIIGMTELALHTTLSSEQREYLEAVKISADSLLRLINDILDFSKIEAGKLELVDMDFSLRDSIANAMTAVSVQAHSKDIELVYHIPPDIPDVVTGDPGRLNQILINLVGNSIKFTEKGEVVVDVKLESESDHELFLHFSIRDTGIGIPLEKQQKIFNAFEQADGSTTRKYGGTGLGLAVSSQLVQLMGGRIWLESEAGIGSVFHFTARLGLMVDTVSPVSPPDISKLRDLPILVVDDNDTNRFVLKEILAYWGMKPVMAESANVALSAIHHAGEINEPFTMVLLDHKMPEIDGFELAERINQDPSLSGITMIMLTSTGQRGDASRCMNLGISAYLLKPIKQSELFEIISSEVNRSSSRDHKRSLVTRHSLRESKRRLNVLLVEDNLINQKLATRILQKMGHSVTVAGNGKEALENLESKLFDVVLMDIQMPEMDGFQATLSIRETERIKGGHIPIVAMTAHAMSGDRERCLEAGMDSYISKPINTEELWDCIEKLVNKNEQSYQTPSPSPQEHGEIINKDQFMERVGGDIDLLKELVDIFVDTREMMLSELDQAIREGNAEATERAAHTIKGAVGNFAADRAFQAALELETMGRDKKMRNAAEAYKILELEIGYLKDALTALSQEAF